jgi:soluble lytic murein transglycosylase-like protein
MQTRTLPYPLILEGEENKQNNSPLRLSSLILAGALFLTAGIPQAGFQISSMNAVEDSSRDLAFVEVVERFQTRLPKSQRKDAYKLAGLLLELSDRYMVSPALLLSVIETESSFRTNAVSKAGAVGLMQLLPGTAREVAEKYGVRGYKTAADLFDPATNLRLGVAYISYLRGRFGHSVHYLAAYNMGPTALRSRIVKGNYELGAIESYVRKIQTRTLALRKKSTSSGSMSRSLHRAKRLTAMAL